MGFVPAAQAWAQNKNLLVEAKLLVTECLASSSPKKRKDQFAPQAGHGSSGRRLAGRTAPQHGRKAESGFRAGLIAGLAEKFGLGWWHRGQVPSSSSHAPHVAHSELFRRARSCAVRTSTSRSHGSRAIIIHLLEKKFILLATPRQSRGRRKGLNFIPFSS
ncbi:MAG: hypothetical protein A3H70_00585 [Candidatus Komeilibacteria bacterium RIFCSPLOWO2_02_FULL_48_11]|uniref:Uncharacterized protein n=1 Tax=Candidatus Komeilibacteria bacterium RIFCSPLOWO2_02_FULL_48_11 TaxID=1798553 RepID=A0A1G2BTV7_9BACT|nr:MAG: hypothetical protein A3H70_00585 [Candidatus Komeilibacteria bacterium RIFCSPLOWO2_02_FULL_48_11]